MSESATLLIDGQPACAVDALDRGLHYGDGLFETIKVAGGRPLFWPRHLARLAHGCERLRIPPPPSGLLQAEAERLCAGQGDGVLKLVITRGSAGRGYRPPEQPAPRRLLTISAAVPWPEAYGRDGIAVRYCTARLGLNPSLAGIKHLNRLEQVLGRAELELAVHPEGLMLDAVGNVIEGTMTNLFVVRGGELLTPRLDRAGVAGVTRARVLDAAAALGLGAREAALRPANLASAEELFVTNSLIGLWPVRELAGAAFAVGPVTRRLGEALKLEEAELHG